MRTRAILLLSSFMFLSACNMQGDRCSDIKAKIMSCVPEAEVLGGGTCSAELLAKYDAIMGMSCDSVRSATSRDDDSWKFEWWGNCDEKCMRAGGFLELGCYPRDDLPFQHKQWCCNHDQSYRETASFCHHNGNGDDWDNHHHLPGYGERCDPHRGCRDCLKCRCVHHGEFRCQRDDLFEGHGHKGLNEVCDPYYNWKGKCRDGLECVKHYGEFRCRPDDHYNDHWGEHLPGFDQECDPDEGCRDGYKCKKKYLFGKHKCEHDDDSWGWGEKKGHNEKCHPTVGPFCKSLYECTWVGGTHTGEFRCRYEN